MNTIKKKLLGLSIAVCALSFTGAMLADSSPKEVSASTNGLTMVPGAAVRLKLTDEEEGAVNGLRFEAQMTKAYYESLQGSEVVLSSTATANGRTQTVEWVLQSEDTDKVETPAFNKDGIARFYHTITFDSLFDEEDLLRQANAFEIEGSFQLESDVDAEDQMLGSVTRSMRQVAYKAYNTPSTEEEPNAGYNNETLLNYFTPSSEQKVYYSNGVEDTTTVGNMSGMKVYANNADGKFLDISNEAVNTLYGENATLGVKAETVTFDENNVAYNTTLQSATILYTAEDVRALLHDDGKTATPNKSVEGYYALANDIVVDTWGDSKSRYLTFAGVFDGNGYKLTVPMRYYGLFGVLDGQVKNTWLEFTNVNTNDNYGRYPLLAYNCTKQFKINNEAQNTLENLYITIDEATFDGANMPSFALMTTSTAAAYAQNVIVDYGDLLTQQYTKNHGLWTTYYHPSGTAQQSLSNFEDVYFISSGLKYLNNRVEFKYTESGTNAHKVTTLYATNDEANKATDLETWREADEADETLNGSEVTYTQYVATDIYRYDDWTAFDSAENKDFSSFPAEYWTIEKKTEKTTIRWKGNAFDYDEILVKTAINGQESSEGALISDENSAKNKATLSVAYGEAQANIISATATEGAELVTIEGAVVSAVAGKTGNATVSVVYKLPGDNVLRTTTVAFEISAYEISNEVLLWSSNRDSLYKTENFGTITKIINLADDSVLYDGETYTTATLDNATNVPTTFDVLVERQNASKVKMTLKSYTDYFSTEEELTNVFNVAVATTVGTNACYILAKDITVATWANNAKNLTFAGVFDGNGYKLTVPMRYYGLFGVLDGQVKNTWLEFTNVKQVDSYGRNSLLAFNCTKQFKINNEVQNTLENLYITIDEATFNGEGLTSFALMTTSIATAYAQNVIVDYGDLLTQQYTQNHGLWTAYYNPNAAYVSLPYFEDVYFISSGLKYLNNRVEFKYTESGTNAHKVTTLYATNDEANKATDLTAWQEADSADEKLNGATVTYNQYVAAGIYRYDNWTKFDSAENKDFSSFDAEYWTIEENSIRWKVK